MKIFLFIALTLSAPVFGMQPNSKKNRSCCGSFSEWRKRQALSWWVWYKDRDAYKELIHAAKTNNVSDVRRLISYGLNASGVEGRGFYQDEMSPLNDGIEAKSEDALCVLVDAGAELEEVHVKRIWDSQDFSIPFKQKILDTFLLSLKERKAFKEKNSKCTIGSVLNYFVGKQQIDQVQYILEQNPFLNIGEKYELLSTGRYHLSKKYSPLECATKTGNKDIIQLLLDQNSPVSSKALFAAILYGDTTIVFKLLKKAARATVQLGCEKGVQILLKRQEDACRTKVNFDHFGSEVDNFLDEAPCHVGLYFAAPDMIRFLCRCGVNPNWWDSQGVTSIGHLDDTLPTKWEGIQKTVFSKEKRLQALLDCGASIEEQDKKGHTLFHRLAIKVNNVPTSDCSLLDTLIAHPRFIEGIADKVLQDQLFTFLCVLRRYGVPLDLRCKMAQISFPCGLEGMPFRKLLRTLDFEKVCKLMPRDIQYACTNHYSCKDESRYGPVFTKKMFVDWYTKRHLMLVQRTLESLSNDGRKAIELVNKMPLVMQLHPNTHLLDYHWHGKIEREYKFFFENGMLYSEFIERLQKKAVSKNIKNEEEN